eukprot:9414417-Pyramimonas_sp.AAC.1
MAMTLHTYRYSDAGSIMKKTLEEAGRPRRRKNLRSCATCGSTYMWQIEKCQRCRCTVLTAGGFAGSRT